MQALNFSTYNFRFKSKENRLFIFDLIRKKFVVLQPEEWVRQHCIHYLLYEKHYPKSLINVEKQLTLNGLKKRYDIVVYTPRGNIAIIVECKAPNIAINQLVFNQITRYNMALNATYLMVTNGINHYYCKINVSEARYDFLKSLPNYNQKSL